MPFLPSESYDPADIVRGQANAEALDLIDRWPDWPYSIVLLVGATGSGKTHLAHRFARRARATFLAPEHIGSVPGDQLLTGNHAWVLDGLESCLGQAAALAQLINMARARGDYLLFTAEHSPAQLSLPLPDLRSRLLALPHVTLHAPDDALLTGVLAKLFADRQLRVSPEVLALLIQRLDRTYEAAAEAVRAIDHYSLARGKPITNSLVREWCANGFTSGT